MKPQRVVGKPPLKSDCDCVAIQYESNTESLNNL